MNKIKIGLSILAIGMLATTASAECSKTTCIKKETTCDLTKDYIITTKNSSGKEFYLNITNIRPEVHAGLSSTNVFGEREPNWSAGVGISATVDDNIYVGTNVDLEYENTQGSHLTGITGEIKGGYVINKDFTGYGLVGVKSVNYQHGVDGTGLGIGAGVEYTLCSHSALDLEYKSYAMKLDGGNPDYNHESLGVKFKYFF